MKLAMDFKPLDGGAQAIRSGKLATLRRSFAAVKSVRRCAAPARRNQSRLTINPVDGAT
jgi:hypothetical protein